FLSATSKAGSMNDIIQNRIDTIGIDNFEFSSFPTTFFDVFGENGINIRTTISEMGPIMLSRLLSLNDTQSGVL
uniref:helicase HerA-like domain-containing protein n=1 Tax=Oceanivirga salmonicida TaxID=1769291 RepID=UPI000ACEB9EC